MFENVVVCVPTGLLDDQTRRDVVALAKRLVSPHGKLTLLHVHFVKPKPGAESSAPDTTKYGQALRQMETLAGEFSVDADLQCVEAQSPRRGLHDFSARQGADLLVIAASIGAHDRMPLGDDTRRTLDDAPCAVAVAPAGIASRPGAIKTIGVGFDGSVESERALAVARRLAAELRAELSAFEAVPVPAYAHDPWNVRGDVGEQVEAARRRVAALGHLEARAGFGDPVHELARYARSVDLLVLGGHDYRPIDHVRALSTAQRLAGEVSSRLLVLPATTRTGA